MTGAEALIAESAALRAPVGLVLGALAGSLVATLLIRWPERRRALLGRSRCDACGRALAWRETVPLISFFALGGRCRTCRVPIDPRHIVIELGAAALGMLVLAFQAGWPGLVGAALGWWLLLVAALDVDRRWLPPVLSAPLAPAGLALALVGIGPPAVERAAVAAAAFALLFLTGLLWRRLRKRPLYPGLALLAAGLGAWLGLWLVLAALLAAFLALVAGLVQRTRGRGGGAGPAAGAALAVVSWLIWAAFAAKGGLLWP